MDSNVAAFGSVDLFAAANALACRLDALANELSDDERDLLLVVLVRAMNPLQRMRYLDPGDLLSADELRILGGLPPAPQE
jgi:hypothetical protein